VPLLLRLCTALLVFAITPAHAERYDFDRSRFTIPAKTAAADSGQVRLVFVGDCKFGGRTAQQMARHGQDYPFALVRDELRGADIAFANYESAITACTQQSLGKPASLVASGRAFVFKSDPISTGSILADAGIDIVQLANNHAMDFGPQGLLDTLAALDGACIAHVGAGADWPAAIAPVVITVNGTRVGYLAYSAIVPAYSAAKGDAPGISYVGADYRTQLTRDIGGLRDSCDVVVVGFHWGIEGRTAPDTNQRAIGHAAVDAGADIVIGTHPHTFQGVEFYGAGVIAYSLGNFVFTGASRRLAGGILAVALDTDGLSVELLLCWINDGRPTPSTDPSLQRELARIMRTTESQLAPSDGGWLRVEPRDG
jgi:poly-gamma-glutamate capsule biosynthesis protein CapA/YwtB (metallophosphatase superfamily)